MLQKENNPWVGLASYKRQDAARFYGREKETRLLSELIQTNYCTILYGKSGAGKTSLIQAGVCPLLADARYLPLSMKLTHDGTTPYARQITDRIEEAIRAVGGEVEFPVAIPDGIDEESRAWLFFHTANFWDGQNYRVIPAVFIDQFEELFNLTADVSLVGACFRTIDTILQMTPPEKVSDAFARLNARLPFNEKPAFRLILSLREDFLARLEDYSYNIPALRRNRVGLASMNGLQALEVITRPIPGLVERDAALKILSKVTATEIKDDEYFLERLSVDSCILSLFCTEIYDKSAESGKDGITMDIIDQFGNDIIQKFYQRNMEDISSASARYLESILLTTNGFRNLVALEDLAPKHVRMEELRKLEENRIIRIETINGTERVEFTHDVLCKVAADHQKAIHAKGEKSRVTRIHAAMIFEVALNFGIFSSFFHCDYFDPLDVIRTHPGPFVLLFGGFLLNFLVRIEHHCKKYRSLLVMSLAAILSGVSYYVLVDSSIGLSETEELLLSIHLLSGIVYLFSEAALRLPNRHGLFFADSLCFWKDADRLLATQVFLTLCYVSLCLLSHRTMNGTLGIPLLLSLPFLLLGWAHVAFEKTPHMGKVKKAFILSAEAGILLLAISPYVGTKVWYFLALLVLALATFRAGMRIPGEKRYWKLLGSVAVWAIAFFLLPTYVLGFSIPSLGKLARVPHGTIVTESLPHRMMKVRGPDGARGVFYDKELILPPEYEDVRLYAKSHFSEYPALSNGHESVQEISFFVKDFGSKDFRELPLSQSPGARNRLTRKMADDWLRFLETADSTFRKEQAVLDTSRTNSADITYNKYWQPFQQYYDPDVYLTLATHGDDDGRLHFARQYIVQTLVSSLASRFLLNGGWRPSKENIQSFLLFDDFHRRTRISKIDLLQDDFLSWFHSETEYRPQIDSILSWSTEEALQRIMDNPDWRARTYEALSSGSNREQWHRLLSLREPEIDAFLSRLIDQEEESPINAAFYSLFQGRYEAAESLSRKAVEESDTPLNRNTAMTNLVSALFLGGNEQAAKSILDTTAFHHTGSGSILVDALYQDVRDFRRNGALSAESPLYSRYFKLLKTYSKDIFRNYQSTNGKNTAIYYKDYKSYPTHVAFRDAFLFASTPPATPVYENILIPFGEDVALVVDDKGAKGYFNLETGREIYPVQADHAWIFREGKAVLETGQRLQVIDTEGNPVFEKSFPDPRDYGSSSFVAVDFVFYDGLCPMVGEDGKFGLIDLTGTWVLAPEYDYVTNPDEYGYRHLLKDGNLFLLETAEIGGLEPVPSDHPIIVLGKDGIRLWDSRSERQVIYFRPENEVRFVSGKDYRFLLVGDGGRFVTVDHGETSYSDYISYSQYSVLSPDQTLSIQYNKLGGHAFLSPVKSDREICTFPVDPDEELAFKYFSFSQNGEAAVSLRNDGLLQIWAIPSGACIESIELDQEVASSCECISISPDGNSVALAIGNFRENLILHHVGSQTVYRSEHSDYVRSVQFSHDGRWFATCSDDASIILYDSETGEPLKTILTEGVWLFELTISPDDRKIAVKDKEGRISVWDVASGELLNEIQASQEGGIIWSE